MRKYLNIDATNRVTLEQLRSERSKMMKMERLHNLHQFMLQITHFLNKYVMDDVDYKMHWVGDMLPCATWTPYHSTAVVECDSGLKLKVVYSYVNANAPTLYVEVLRQNNTTLGFTPTYPAVAIYNVMCRGMRQAISDMFDEALEIEECHT